MTVEDYKAALAKEQKILAELEAAQKEIEQQIMRRRRRIASLMELAKDAEDESTLMKKMVANWARYNVEQSLTDDIRKIIRNAGFSGIMQSNIRAELSKLGRSIEDHQNPAGTVNSIVKRLIEKGEVEEINAELFIGKMLRWKERDFWTSIKGLSDPSKNNELAKQISEIINKKKK